MTIKQSRRAFFCTVMLFLICLLAFSACTRQDGDSGTDTPEPGESPAQTPIIVPEGLMAARVGDIEISIQEFNYHYLTAYYWFSDYGYAEMLGISDASQLKTTQYDDNTSWADILAEDALSSLRSIVVESEAAKTLGLSLSEERKTELEDRMNSSAEVAATNEMSLEEYLCKLFGQGMTEEIYRSCLERIHMADEWVSYVTKDVDLSEEALEAYLQSHLEDYELCDFNAFYIEGTLYDENGAAVEGEEQTSYAEQQEALAKEMVSRLTGDNFAEIAVDYLAEGETAPETFAAGVTLEDMSFVEGLTDFVTDESRKAGDAGAFAAEGGWYVIQFSSLYVPSDRTVNVRHVLIGNEEEGAEARAEDLYRLWQEGEASEESFASMAQSYSEDPGSQSEGGLYTEVTKGMMVETFNAWCFDPERAPGDTGIVETSYGYHIMYFSGFNDPSWKVSVRDAIQREVADEARAALPELDTEMYDVLMYVGQ